MTPSRRRGFGGGLVALALAALGWWLSGDPAAQRADRADPAASGATAPAPAAAPAPAMSAPPSAPAPTTTAEASAERRRGEVPSLARRAAYDYRQRARFPPFSHPLTPEEDDPILRDREVTAVKARGPQGEEPTLYVAPERTSFEAPETVILFAYLAQRDNPVPAREIRGTVTTEEGTALGDIEYRDDGVAGDRLAGDRIYTAAFTPSLGATPPLAASYMIRVRAVTMGGDDRVAAGSFLYSAPHARLTGRYRDDLAGGSLMIEAEVEVLVAGRFHLEGTLYDAAGTRKLAWAQTASPLEPGTTWLTLPFYGLALREAGVDGPYLVRYLALSTTTQMPNAKNRLIENPHVTRAYRAAQFTEDPFGDRDLLDAAERLERDGLRGALEAGQ